MRTCLCVSVLSLGLFMRVGVAPAQEAAPAPRKWVSPAVTLAADRASALYTCQDKAVFIVTVLSGGQPADGGFCTVKLTLDGGETLSEKRYDLADGNPVRIEAGLEKPGFIRCDFMGVEGCPISLRARAAAGFDVEKIKQGHPEPPDFEAYWAALLKRQAAIENAVQAEPLPDSVGKPGYQYFKITVKTVDDGRAYGFLGIPAGRPGPFAALTIVAAAGPGYDIPEPTFIRPDLITLTLNVHPIDPGLPTAEYQQRYKDMIAETPYWQLGAPDRDRYHFRNALIGAQAAVNYLTAHPRFDGTNLFYLGSSQGGGFGLMLGGLCPRFSAIAICVPALCDHGGVAVGRASGWPQLVKDLAGRDEALRGPCLDMSAYFDAVNFARRVRCPIIFTVGFSDATCCPSSVYAAFNAVGSTKYIMTAPLADHAVPWEHLNGIWQWIQNGMDESARTYRAYFKY